MPDRGRFEALRLIHNDPTRTDVFALADEYKRKRRGTVGKMLSALAGGIAFAEAGDRDGAIWTLCNVLAEKWPYASTDAIVGLFASSAEIMEAAAPVEIPILEAVESKWSRITGERADAAASEAEAAAMWRGNAWALVGQVRTDALRVGGIPIVAHHGKSVFVRVGAWWHGPVTRDFLTPAVWRDLGALYGLEIPDTPTLLGRWGVALAGVSESLAARVTTYDPIARTIEVAAAPIRADLVPERSEAAEVMIRELGGEWAGHLTWWLCGLLRTDHPCAALVLSGPKNTAKSALLAGLGRLWKGGAAKMRDVLGKRFNAAGARSWLAVADDDTGEAEAGRALATYLREAVSDRTQRMERKHLDVTSIDGCMRFAVATNDAFALVRGAVSYDLNDESLSAFADRILHVPVRPEAAGWWERSGVEIGELVEGDGLARHVLWLATQVPEGYRPPGCRFWTQPADTTLGRLAVLSSGLRADILVKIALEIADGGCRAGVELGATRGLGAWCAPDAERRAILVHPRGLYASWGDDIPRGATVRTIGLAVAALSRASNCDPYKHTKGSRIYAIDIELVQWYADLCGVW
jgi:hypothetical protein